MVFASSEGVKPKLPDSSKLAPLPDFLLEALRGSKTTPDHQGGEFPPSSGSTDSKQIKRARAYLVKSHPAISGQGGHNQTFKVACKLVHGFHLDVDAALGLLLEIYNPRCEPPWTVEELRHKVTDAKEKGCSPDMGPGKMGQSKENSGEKEKKWGKLLIPVPASKLKDICGSEGETWIIKNIAGEGRVTLFSGKAKEGKSTCLASLLAMMGEGGTWCGLSVMKGRALVISEESETHWEDRRKRFGIGDWVSFQCRPFPSRPIVGKWTVFLEECLAFFQAGGFHLLVIDTIENVGPIQEENNNSEISSVMRLFGPLLKARVGILLMHHHGHTQYFRGGVQERNRARGGSEWEGSSDYVIDFKDAGGRERTLKFKGRYHGDVPEPLTVELGSDGRTFSAVGEEVDLWELVHGKLPFGPPGFTVADLFGLLPKESGIAQKTIANGIKEQAGKRGWKKEEGSGVHGKPARYYRAG